MYKLIIPPIFEKEKKKSFCQICKREISDPESVRRGMGKICFEKQKQAQNKIKIPKLI